MIRSNNSSNAVVGSRPFQGHSWFGGVDNEFDVDDCSSRLDSMQSKWEVLSTIAYWLRRLRLRKNELFVPFWFSPSIILKIRFSHSFRDITPSLSSSAV
mmetsp:Transcript_26705/g.43931  ORF Transcript_26705/g.43931 Transcript_26705/m.43931 type:complete len:99 (+) Transcript_26705:662-958(+)